jgi:hypothetical protein
MLINIFILSVYLCKQTDRQTIKKINELKTFVKIATNYEINFLKKSYDH